MRRWIVLGAIFLISLGVFLVALMPAAVVVERMPMLRPGGERLLLSDARGRWWHGSVMVRWREQQGRLSWALDWHGLTPGVWLDLDAGDLNAQGWLGGLSSDGWRLEQWHGTMPVALVSRYVPQGDATGLVEVSLMALELDGGVLVDAKGVLHYGGGVVSWGRQGEGAAQVPPLDGVLSLQAAGPVLVITGPQKQQLVRADISKGKLHVKVRRAWPQLLGVSQGGNPNDVVFSLSRPVSLGAVH